MRRARIGMLGVMGMLLVACGSDTSTGGGGTATCTLGVAATVTISASGVTPKQACIVPNGTVTFVNSDTVAHDIEADTPSSCPLLAVGSIPAGGTRPVSFPTAQSCGYHDAGSPSNAAFQGTVSVAAAGTPGY